MRNTYKLFALLACGLLGTLALVAANGLGQPQKESTPSAQGKLTGETQTPMLLDASLKLSAKAKSQEIKDVIFPYPSFLYVTMEVLVDGRPLPTIFYENKAYLPVPQTGKEYQIRIWHHGPRRVSAVVSVDGLSVITGRRASEDDPGYVIAPYSSILIKGWRRNFDRVAAFRFVDHDKSYASLMGKSENIGVIGLVAFEERIIHPFPELEKRETSAKDEGFRAAVGSIGTEYGRNIDSQAHYVPFIRSGEKQSITLYYDTVKALRAAGVPVDRPYPVPFPGELKFAPPPPGYHQAGQERG